jgi:hypothetical protein
MQKPKCFAKITSYGPFGILSRKDIFLAIYDIMILANARLQQVVSLDMSDSIVSHLQGEKSTCTAKLPQREAK